MAGSRERSAARQRRRVQDEAAAGRALAAATAVSWLPVPLLERLDDHLELFARHMHEGVLAAATAVGLEVLDELMEAEAVEVAGPKGKHCKDRTAKRHGPTDGTITLGGRQVSISRPRVRSADGTAEVPLATYAAAANNDLMAAGILARMLAGVSTRRYGESLEPVGADVDAAARSTSRSSVSRRFVAATKARLDELQGRRLDDRRWLVIYLDGFNFGDHMLVGALGVTADGTKVPLGVVEGHTENGAVCKRLVADLADRGLDAGRGVLFVVDGSKALSSAIKAVFGTRTPIQRCRRHKERNVLDHLPESERGWVKRKLRAAWAQPDPAEAKAALDELARSLQKARPGAAASLREGLEETITVNRLGVTGSLLKTLESTNPMESTVDIVRDHACRVKRWQDGEMALRWAARWRCAGRRPAWYAPRANTGGSRATCSWTVLPSRSPMPSAPTATPPRRLQADTLRKGSLTSDRPSRSLYGMSDERRRHDALDRLRDATRDIDAATRAQRTAVARALHWGATWAQVADALGVTPQAAHQRFRRVRYDPKTGRAWDEPQLPL